MKKFNLKIVSIAVVLATSGGAANAQWATFDVANFGQSLVTAAQSTIAAAQGTITAAQSTLTSGYTFLTSRAAAATGQAVKSAQASIDAGTAQGVQNLGTAAILEAVNKGHDQQAKMGIEMLPTLAMCAEASKSEAKAASASSAMRSTSGGKNGGAARTMAVTSTAAAQSNVLKTKVENGTCTPETAGAGGCQEAGKYAGGDMHPKGIKGDTKDLAKNEATNNGGNTNDSTPSYNNYTLEDGSGNGFDVAKKYAADMAYYDKPKVAPKEQMAKNPSYAAVYSSMETKLNAAHDAVVDIMKIRRASSKDITSTIAGKEWSQISDYAKVTGLVKKPQGNPSLFDMLNYSVRNDYFGNKDAKLDTIDEVNKRLAMTNFIAWNQYQQQENTNLLLAHILVQLTTPVSKGQVDSEHAKTMNVN